MKDDDQMVEVSIWHEVREGWRLFFLPLTALAQLTWVLLKGKTRITIRAED